MANFLEENAVGRYLRPLIAAAILFPVLLIVRYRAGVHYSAVAVELTDSADAGEDLMVWVVSPFGSSRLLQRAPWGANVYRSKDFFAGPVRAIRVGRTSPGSVPITSIRVLLGAAKDGWSRTMTLGEMPAPKDVGLQDDLPSRYFGQSEGNGSLLGIASRCFNWQGDLWFLAVCLAQSIGIVLFVCSVWSIFRNCMKWDDVEGVMAGLCAGKIRRVLIWLPVSSMLFVMLLILVQQLICEVSRIVSVGDAAEHLLGLILLMMVIGFLLATADGRLDYFGKLNGRFRSCCALAMVFLFLIRFMLAGHWPWYQTGDYARYWRFGGLMSAGEWGDIYDGFLGTEMMAVRAFLYSFPIRFLSGNSFFVLFFVNGLFLTGAALVLYKILAPYLGRRRALLGVVLFSFHPDILFGGHLCRHGNRSQN